MTIFRFALDKEERDLLLESLGDSCDNAADDDKARGFEYLFEDIKNVDGCEDSSVYSSHVDKVAVGRIGNGLVEIMRRIVKSEENGSSRDVSWHTHELCAMIRGISAAGFNVTVKPQLQGAFRCVEVEGMVFKV